MDRVRRVCRVFCAILSLLAPASGNGTDASSSDYARPIQLAVNYWLAGQEASGFLPYGFDFLQNEASESHTMSAPNLTRQAGVAAALANYYAQSGDPRARPAIEKLLMAFGTHSLPIGKRRLQSLIEKARLLSSPIGRYKIRAALEKYGLLYQESGPGKVLAPVDDYRKAHTGAVALALLTELRYAQATGDGRFADLRRAWLKGLMQLWIPGEGFRQMPTSIDTTPYYDGEAWLALAEYHRAFPQDRRVADFLAEVDATLLKKYGAQFKLDAYHWGMMAAAARYANTGDSRFLAFIREYTRKLLDRKKDRVGNDNDCALAEGVADAQGALLRAGEGRSELAGRMQAWLKAEMDKARQLQIQPGQQEIVFPKARIFAPRMQDYAGCFRSGVDTAYTQVDFTGHCVSAMLKLQRNAALDSRR